MHFRETKVDDLSYHNINFDYSQFLFVKFNFKRYFPAVSRSIFFNHEFFINSTIQFSLYYLISLYMDQQLHKVQSQEWQKDSSLIKIINDPRVKSFIENHLHIQGFCTSVSTIFAQQENISKMNPLQLDTYIEHKTHEAVAKLTFPHKPSPNSVCGKEISTYYQCHDCKQEYIIYCEECFQYEQHKGHMFCLIQNSILGYCDCGNKAMLKEESFCPKHKAQEAPIFSTEQFESIKEELLYVTSFSLAVALQKNILSNMNEQSLLIKIMYYLANLCKNSRFYHNVISETFISLPNQLILKREESIATTIICRSWSDQLQKAVNELLMTLAHSLQFSQHILPIIFKFVSTKGSAHNVKAHYFIKYVWEAAFQKQAISALICESNIKYLVVQEEATSSNGSIFFNKFYNLIGQIYPGLFLKMTLLLIKKVPVAQWLNIASLVGHIEPDIKMIRQKIDSFFIALNRDKKEISSEDWQSISKLAVDSLKLMLQEDDLNNQKLFLVGRILIHSFLTYTKFDMSQSKDFMDKFHESYNTFKIEDDRIIDLLIRISFQMPINSKSYNFDFIPLNISLDYLVLKLLLSILDKDQSYSKLNGLIINRLTELKEKSNTLTDPQQIQITIQQYKKILLLMKNILNTNNIALSILIPKHDIGKLAENSQISKLYRELALVYRNRNKKQYASAAIIYIYSQEELKQFINSEFQAIKKEQISVNNFRYKIPFDSALCKHQNHEQIRMRFMIQIQSKPEKIIFNAQVQSFIIEVGQFILKKAQQIPNDQDDDEEDSQSSLLLNCYFEFLMTLYIQTKSQKISNIIHNIRKSKYSAQLNNKNKNTAEMYEQAFKLKMNKSSSQKQKQIEKVNKLKLKKQQKMQEMKQKQKKIIRQQLQPDLQHHSKEQNENNCIVCKQKGHKQQLFFLCHVSYHNVLMKSMLQSNKDLLLFTTCGHMIHNSCLLTSLDGNSSYHSSYKCFLCKKKSNARLPVECKEIGQKQIDSLINDILAILALDEEKFQEFGHQTMMVEDSFVSSMTADKFYCQVYRSLFLGIYMYFMTDPHLFQLFMQPIVPALLEITRQGMKKSHNNVISQLIDQKIEEKQLTTMLQTLLMNYIVGTSKVHQKQTSRVTVEYENFEDAQKYVNNMLIQLQRQFYIQPEVQNKFQRFTIFRPPQQLTNLKRLASKCSFCHRPSDKIRLCFLCDAKTCQLCQLKWKGHLLENHKGITVSVMVRNGVYYYESPNGYKAFSSLYRSYLGQIFSSKGIEVTKGQYELDIKLYDSIIEDLVLDSVHSKIKIQNLSRGIPMNFTL